MVRASQCRALQRGGVDTDGRIRVGAGGAGAGGDRRHGAEARAKHPERPDRDQRVHDGDPAWTKGVTDVTNLSNLAPNVNLDASYAVLGRLLGARRPRSAASAQDDFAFNIDPGVGVYLDGVFLARTFGANQNLLDVDRVEILRGPQGTLFGRNTIGGAINIVTHDPGTEANFEAQATVGSYDRMDLGFTADLPITDTLLSSLTLSSIDRGGYQKVIPYPADSALGQQCPGSSTR